MADKAGKKQQESGSTTFQQASSSTTASTSTQQQQPPQQSTWVRTLKQMLAGGTAGAISKTCVAPFERVKILCQNGKSRGILRTFRQIYRDEGVLRFWAGNNANVIRVLPNRAVLFTSNERLKKLAHAHHFLDNYPTFLSTTVGSIAGAVSVATTYPLDLVRGRMGGLLGPSKYTTMWVTVKVTAREEGWRALFKGLGPTVVGALPYEGIKFGIYDFLARRVPELEDALGATWFLSSFPNTPDDPVAARERRARQKKGDLSVGWSLVVGGIAGAGSGTITYPIDTIRRRMQMQGTEALTEATTYRNSRDCLIKMVRFEGARSLFAGVLANCWRVAPAAAIQFGAFEFLKSILHV